MMMAEPESGGQSSDVPEAESDKEDQEKQNGSGEEGQEPKEPETPVSETENTGNKGKKTLSGRKMKDDEEGNGIKLGLGDFVFYSVLMARAALTDMLTVFAAYIAIITGLFGTLIILGIAKRALPALPISIALGTLFYFVSRYVIIPFVFSNALDIVSI